MKSIELWKTISESRNPLEIRRQHIASGEINDYYEELKYFNTEAVPEGVIVNFIIAKTYNDKISYIYLNHQLYALALDSMTKYVEYEKPDLVNRDTVYKEYVKELLSNKGSNSLAVRTLNTYIEAVEGRARSKCLKLMNIIDSNNAKHYKQYSEEYQQALLAAQEIQITRLRNIAAQHPKIKNIKSLVMNYNFHLYNVPEQKISDSTKVQLWCSVDEAKQLLSFIKQYKQKEELFIDCRTKLEIDNKATVSVYLDKTYEFWWKVFTSSRFANQSKYTIKQARAEEHKRKKELEAIRARELERQKELERQQQALQRERDEEKRLAREKELEAIKAQAELEAKRKAETEELLNRQRQQQSKPSVKSAIDVESLAKKAYRTKSKTKALVPDITEEELNDKEESMVKNYFPMKYNKRFMVHHLAPPGTFQMDLFFSGPYVYLLAINSASRKVFAICTNQYGLNPKSTPQLIKALKDLMKVTAVRNIEMDGESAMYSNDMQLFLNANGITLRKCNDGHTQLALVDRFCRTLRDIFNNITNGEYYNQPTGQTASSGNVITPEVMNAIVEIYNNAPHDTLNKVIRYRVVDDDGNRYSLTPNLVDSIPELQNIYYKNMMSMNYLQMTQDGYELPVGTLVSVYNERNSYMDKRRTVIRPKLYRVVERVGGMYKCVNVNDDTDVVVTSRIKLSPAIGKLKFKDFN